MDESRKKSGVLRKILLMHAVGVNVSGQIASVLAGGLLLALFG